MAGSSAGADNDSPGLDSLQVANQTDSNTFASSSRALAPVNEPSYTSTRTWKSQAVLDKEEFERFRQRVRRFAPEHFKANAKPGKGPAGIFPQNVREWKDHKIGMLDIAQAEQAKNIMLLRAQIEATQKIPIGKRKINSVFGEGGKVFNDIYSPVLCIGSIWSRGNILQPAPWPCKAELQAHGDSKAVSFARTRPSVVLPHPRYPADVADQMVAPGQPAPFLAQLPFDASGPFFANGPTPEEIYINNCAMDNDLEFEKLGNFYLGSALMEEIGHWRPPFVPEWRREQLAEKGQLMIIPEEDGMFGTPDVGDATWQDDSMLSHVGDESQIWY